MNMPGIYLAVGILALALLIVAGRALFMFWFGTAEIVKQNKEIIRLLTVLADNTSPHKAALPDLKTQSAPGIFAPSRVQPEGAKPGQYTLKP